VGRRRARRGGVDAAGAPAVAAVLRPWASVPDRWAPPRSWGRERAGVNVRRDRSAGRAGRNGPCEAVNNARPRTGTRSHIRSARSLPSRAPRRNPSGVASS
jgi:hypothetical protein